MGADKLVATATKVKAAVQALLDTAVATDVRRAFRVLGAAEDEDEDGELWLSGDDIVREAVEEADLVREAVDRLASEDGLVQLDKVLDMCKQYNPKSPNTFVRGLLSVLSVLPAQGLWSDAAAKLAAAKAAIAELEKPDVAVTQAAMRDAVGQSIAATEDALVVARRDGASSSELGRLEDALAASYRLLETGLRHVYAKLEVMERKQDDATMAIKADTSAIKADIAAILGKLEQSQAVESPISRRPQPDPVVGDAHVRLYDALWPEVETVDAPCVTQRVTAVVHPVAYTGFGGMGKTEAVKQAAFMSQERGKCPDGIVWIVADSLAALHAGLRQGFHFVPHVSDPKLPMDSVGFHIRAWLRDARRRGWMVVFDNVDDAGVLGEIHRLILKEDLTCGVGHVVITSRLSGEAVRKCVSSAQTLPVAQLDMESAMRLLWSKGYGQDGEDGEGVTDLASYMAAVGVDAAAAVEEAAAVEFIAGAGGLDRLPLALVQAGSYVYAEESTFVEYRILLEEYRSNMFAEDEDVLLSARLSEWLPTVDGGLSAYADVLEREYETLQGLVGVSDAKLESAGLPSRLVSAVQLAVERARDSCRRNVKTTWSISMDKVGAAAQQALSVLSVCAPDNVPVSVVVCASPWLVAAGPELHGALSVSSSGGGDAAAAPRRRLPRPPRRGGRTAAVAVPASGEEKPAWQRDMPAAAVSGVFTVMDALAAHSLVSWDAGAGVVSMHRLVQLVVQDGMREDGDGSGSPLADAGLRGLFGVLPGGRLCDMPEWDAGRREWHSLAVHIDAVCAWLGYPDGPLFSADVMRVLCDVGLRGAAAYIDLSAWDEASRLLDKVKVFMSEVIAATVVDDEWRGRRVARLLLECGVAEHLGRSSEARTLSDGIGTELHETALEDADLGEFASEEAFRWVAGHLNTSVDKDAVRSLLPAVEEGSMPWRRRQVLFAWAAKVEGHKSLNSEDFGGGEAAFGEAEALLGQAGASDCHPLVAVVSNAWGRLFFKQDRLDEALRKYKQSLEMQRRVHGDADHVDIATSLNNIGGVLLSQGRLDEALRTHQASLDMRRRVYGDVDHGTIATSLDNIGSVLLGQGRLDAALRKHEESLEMSRLVHGGVDGSDIATNLSNMGSVLLRQGRLDDALRKYKESLEIYLRVYGTVDHGDVAASLNNIGGVLLSQGRLDEALRTYTESLEMKRRVYGDVDHGDVAVSLSNIGSVLEGQGRLDEALRKYEESLEMKRRVYGDVDHCEIATDLGSVGNVFRGQGHLSEALQKYQESLEMRRRVYGDVNHNDIATSLSCTAVALFNAQLFDDAIEVFDAAVAYVRRMVEPPDGLQAELLAGRGTATSTRDRAVRDRQGKRLEMKQRVWSRRVAPVLAAVRSAVDGTPPPPRHASAAGGAGEGTSAEAVSMEAEDEPVAADALEKTAEVDPPTASKKKHQNKKKNKKKKKRK